MSTRKTEFGPRELDSRAARGGHLAWLVALFLGVLSAGLVGGCGSGPDISGRDWRGPAVTLEPASGFHTVVFEAPSPGWEVEFDGWRRRLDADEVFVTMRRPDPEFVYPAGDRSMRTLTSVRTDRPIRVYGRVLKHSKSGGTYRVAAEAD